MRKNKKPIGAVIGITAITVCFVLMTISSRTSIDSPPEEEIDSFELSNQPSAQISIKEVNLSNIISSKRTPMDQKEFNKLARRWKEKSYAGVDEYIYFSTSRLRLKPLNNSVPIRPEFGPVINDVTSFRYPINVRGCKDGQLVFIAVISSVSHFEKRQMIRQTWIRHLDELVGGIAFIVGLTSDLDVQKKLEEESSTCGDIVQIDAIDNFQLLTIKVAALLNWLHRHCPSIPFVLKCDDDIYVNVRNLMAVIRSLPLSEKFIYGQRHSNLGVQRDSEGLLIILFLSVLFLFVK